MSFELRVVKELLPTSWDFANVHSFSMSHLVLSIRTLVCEYFSAIVLLANVLLWGCLIVYFSILNCSKVIQSLLYVFFILYLFLKRNLIHLVRECILNSSVIFGSGFYDWKWTQTCDLFVILYASLVLLSDIDCIQAVHAYPFLNPDITSIFYDIWLQNPSFFPFLDRPLIHKVFSLLKIHFLIILGS